MPRILVLTLGLVAACLFAGSAAMSAGTPPGTTIQNTAGVTFKDPDGNSYSILSNTVVTTIQNVATLTNTANTPTQTVATGQTVTAAFTLTNTSNGSGAFTVTQPTFSGTASVGAAVGYTVTISGQPTQTFTGPNALADLNAYLAAHPVAPGANAVVGVQYLVPAGTPPGSTIITTLSATVTLPAGGPLPAVTSSPATASETDTTATGATFNGPGGVNTPITKTVNNVSSIQSSPGATVLYTITFQNTGGIAALNVVATDVVPSGIAPDLSSVKLNGVDASAQSSLSGQTLTVNIGTMPPKVLETITFNGAVSSTSTTGASFTNVATLTSSNATPERTQPAAVFVGVSNIVYDGTVGPSAPINGATVAIVDPATGRPVALTGTPPSSGSNAASVNPTNANPFVTGPTGQYAFAFGAGQFGAPSSPVTYDITIAAPGYINRKIAVTLTPDPSMLLYTALLVSLDGLPLAQAGGFSLTSSNVTLGNVFGLLGNLPMFPPKRIAVIKTADRAFASGGDRIVFTVQYQNGAAYSYGPTQVIDTLPPGLVYAPGTARVDGVALEPTVTARVLTWNFATLDTKAHTIIYAAVVLPGTPAEQTVTNTVTVTATLPGNPSGNSTASASADVRIVSGIFTSCVPITGRVYIDVDHSGHFREGDSGVSGVVVYLENGSSVTTDRFGRYNFPCVSPGEHSLRIDPTTLPPNLHVTDDKRYDSERSAQRLVHGVYDADIIQDINFAVEAMP
ncbi:MAG: isopeptide-forming domain-containing fimbrial protein [Candidatus Eremiobacteraeota bacterium]|nr:isopeptide-forming domain-containing fimbrial protein [Candidatus Eremiobacteraeota bacterium]